MARNFRNIATQMATEVMVSQINHRPMGQAQNAMYQANEKFEDYDKQVQMDNKTAEKANKKVKKKVKKKKEKAQQDEEKALRIQQEREKQYTKWEQDKSKKEMPHDDERNRLTEAMILSEIIGMPRCKSRRSRGYGRRYGS